MKYRFPQVVEKGRVRHGPFKTNPGERFGQFVIPLGGDTYFFVVCSDGSDWHKFFPPPAFEHVSVTLSHRGACLERTPTWEEMSAIKDLFFEPEECVIQYHPPKSQHVNCHPWCLHIWRPVGVEIPIPPMLAVGPAAANMEPS